MSGIFSEQAVFDAFGGFLLNAGFTYHGDVAKQPDGEFSDDYYTHAYLFTHRCLRVCPVYIAREGETNCYLADPAGPGQALSERVWVPYRSRIFFERRLTEAELLDRVRRVHAMTPDEMLLQMADELKSNLEYIFRNLPIGSREAT